jgi:drug/metabolite transporter (DMT)-like permease
MYYGLIMIAVLMFSMQFLFNQRFQREYGSGLKSLLTFFFGYNVAGLLVLLIINGFRVEFTPFTLLLAFMWSINSLVLSYCSFKAFEKVNLSVYSLFSQLGGMMLPFFAGVLLFDEKLTAGSVICFILVLISLLFTVKKGNGGSYLIYYAGIFLLNGMSGVLSKWFAAAPYEKTSSAGYSILSAAVAALLSAVVLLFIKGNRIKLSVRGATNMLGYGVLNKIGNFLLLIALVRLPASVQYPMVTGGVMICSTVICFFTHQKPGKREIASLVLSFVGILALVLL